MAEDRQKLVLATVGGEQLLHPQPRLAQRPRVRRDIPHRAGGHFGAPARVDVVGDIADDPQRTGVPLVGQVFGKRPAQNYIPGRLVVCFAPARGHPAYPLCYFAHAAPV